MILNHFQETAFPEGHFYNFSVAELKSLNISVNNAGHFAAYAFPAGHFPEGHWLAALLAGPVVITEELEMAIPFKRDFVIDMPFVREYELSAPILAIREGE